MPTTTPQHGQVLRDQLSTLISFLSDTFRKQPPQRKKLLKYLALLTGASTTGFAIYKYIQSLNKNESTPKKKKSQLDQKFFSRLRFLINIAVPSVRSPEFISLITLALVVVCRTFISNKLSALSGDLSKVLLEYDWKNFARLLGVSTSISVLSALLAPTLQFLIKKCALRWRERLTAFIQEKYLKDMMYYKTANLSSIVENPDQVVTQDVRKFCDGMCGLFANLVKPVADLLVYTTALVRMTGYAGPVLVLGYMFFSWILISLIRPNFTKLNSRLSALEGNFRYCHVRTATNGESIAFYGGGGLEKTIADDSFEEVYEQKKKLNITNFRFGVFNDLFVFNLPQTISWIICGVPIFFGNVKRQDRGNMARDLRYLAAVITHEFHAIGELIRLRTRLSEINGYTNNICELLETIEDMKKKKDQGSINTGNSIKFENVDLLTPDGKKVLAKNINFEIAPGKNVLVTGPNGSGKSGLFRILGGLWPIPNGTIQKPGGNCVSLKDIYYVPQKPYNVTGTLRDQIIYPNSEKQDVSDDELRALLKKVRIEKIIEREGGFDVEKNWDDILSLGEQQRLAMARLFYHKPKYAILDECTSAVSSDVEKDLYLYAKQLGITCVTISLRPALKAYHDYEFSFTGNGEYKVIEIKH